MNKERFVLCVVAMLACTILTGCGSSELKPHDRLIGQWEGKIELNQAVIQDRLNAAPEQLSPEVAPAQLTRDQLRQQFDSMANMQMEVEFSEDGEMRIKAEVGPLERTVQGTWELTKHEGDTLTVKLTEPEAGVDEQPLTFSGNDSFIMAPPGADTEIGVMRFRRLH